MSLIRNAFRSIAPLKRTITHARFLPSFIRESPRFFSTEGEKPPQTSTPTPEHDAAVDQFLKASGTGFVYGMILGITRNTMKSDVIRLLEESNLTDDDVKVSYKRSFAPDGMMVRFGSPSAFSNAVKTIRKLPMYRLEKVDASTWDIVKPYDGKTVLLQGIPRNALPEDIERFLSGCEYDASSIQFVGRQGLADMKEALVRFPSRTQAMNAFITKNRGFCLNRHILMRVLH